MRQYPERYRSKLITLGLVLVFACNHTNGTNGGSVKQPEVSRRTGSALTEPEAITVAERFVVENGYTDVPATLHGKALSREAIDNEDPERRLRSRENTLKRNACGIYPRNEWANSEGWTVVFCYNIRPEDKGVMTAEDVKDRGRAVTMDLDGSNLRMGHPDIALGAPGFKRLEERPGADR